MIKNWRLIAYDIRDAVRLRKIAKILAGYGHRLQYSVFYCYLSDRETERLRFELKRIMEPEDDLIILGLCNKCVDRIWLTHTDKVWLDEPPRYTVLVSDGQ